MNSIIDYFPDSSRMNGTLPLPLDLANDAGARLSRLYAVLSYGMYAGRLRIMKTRKVTVHLDRDLLRRAQGRTRQGVAATIRHGLELVAASDVYEKIRALRGTVRLSIDLETLREDRR